MTNNEVSFFNSSEWEQKHLEEILKNPPKPVSFTYTVDQLRNIYSSFTPVVDNTPAPRYIEDYYEFHKEPARGDVNKFINAIYEFYSLENKNDLSKVENIYYRIIDNSYDIQIPDEFKKTEQEISEHLNYLRDIRTINRYQQEQEKRKMEQMQQEQQLKEQQISPTERMNNFFNTINGIEQKNNNQQQEETYVTLEQLEPLLSEPGYSYFGHGTGRKGNSDDPVNSIFKEGLRTKDNTLYYTAVGLDVPTPEYIQKCQELGIAIPTIDRLKQKLNNWGHENSKKIIIIRLPDKFINYSGEGSDLDGEMYGAFYNEHQQENGKVNYYLDSKFIVGCYDADKQAVRLNKDFERTLTPETLEQLKEKYKKTVEKTNARKERQTMGITQEEIDLAQQQNQEPVVKYNTDSYDSFDSDDEIEWENTPLEQNYSQEDQINLLKTQIAAYNGEIEMLLASLQPYMQIPKVNQEISKVIAKNNEINASQIIDSLNDYKTVAEIKESLVSYLEKADKFIKDNVGKQQKPVEQQTTQPVSYNTETYDSFDDNIEWNNISSEQEEIEQLKEQIEKYNSKINTLLTNMQPYMQIPKVNREISKIIEKNNEINSSQIIDSLNDYKTVVEIKQSLLSYLEQANKFIKDNVGKQQEPIVSQPQPEQQPTQSLSGEDWKNLFPSEEKQISTTQSFEEIMAEFDKPDPTARPEHKYNSDGTYTMEYIAHLANTPLGFNQTIYDQLMQENELKRQQNEEQMSSGGRHM